jgi:hypothetical protein
VDRNGSGVAVEEAEGDNSPDQGNDQRKKMGERRFTRRNRRSLVLGVSFSYLSLILTCALDTNSFKRKTKTLPFSTAVNHWARPLNGFAV